MSFEKSVLTLSQDIQKAYRLWNHARGNTTAEINRCKVKLGTDLAPIQLDRMISDLSHNLDRMNLRWHCFEDLMVEADHSTDMYQKEWLDVRLGVEETINELVKTKVNGSGVSGMDTAVESTKLTVKLPWC